MHLTRRTTILIVCAVVVFGGAAIYYMSGSSTDSTSAVSASAPASAAELTFVNLVGQLNSLTFDTSILSDPRFTALVDIHTSLVPEAAGRRNPFAPISAGS
jgi:hypothetical protein